MKYISLRKQLIMYYSWRKDIKKRDNNVCQLCHEPGKQVHHILPVSKYPEMEFIFHNGILLCKKCHSESHMLASTANMKICKYQPYKHSFKFNFLRFYSPKLGQPIVPMPKRRGISFK